MARSVYSRVNFIGSLILSQSKELNGVSPPKLANHMMYILVPKWLRDNVIGDLEEEFYEIANKDVHQANKWYWQQSIDTCFVYLRKKLGSIEVLGRLNFYLPLAMFLVVASLVVFLSVFEDPEFISKTFWDELLEGKIHAALFSENFWHNFWSILKMAEWQMFIHIESLLIATFNIGVLLYLDKKEKATALKLAVWGYALAFIPYVMSIAHIASISLLAQQIGPMIATGLISLLYMLLPVSLLVHRKLKVRQADLKKFEREKVEQQVKNASR